MELINDIPRLYTGIAEWAGCLIVLLNCHRRVKNAPFAAISAAAAVLQSSLLIVTAGIDAGIVWIIVMGAAFLLMFLYIFLCADMSAGAALYGAIELAKRPENKGKVIVALLPDSGDRYYSTALFTE